MARVELHRQMCIVSTNLTPLHDWRNPPEHELARPNSELTQLLVSASDTIPTLAHWNPIPSVVHQFVANVSVLIIISWREAFARQATKVYLFS